MKKFSIILLVFITQLGNAQVNKNLGDFDEVTVFDQLEVLLIQDDENTISITGERASEVEVINKNGVLKIRMPFPKLLSGNDCKIVLHYNKLVTINASEGAKVSSDAQFKATLMTLTTKEGAEISLELEAEKLVLKAVTGGKIYLSGSTNNLDCSISAGGTIEAAELISEQATVSVSAGGSATIYATSLVDAKVRAGGSILIHGKPKQINKQTFLGGQIEEIN